MPNAQTITPPLRALVAIASYGSKNIELLKRVVAQWQAMPIRVRIVVLSESPKELGNDVEVLVGLPSDNPWSLPFAHKQLFADHAQDYDIFAYSEDDMEVTFAHVSAFLELTRHLPDDEIAGFLRYEVNAKGSWSYPDVHGHFHWESASARQRGPHTVAEFTNEHAAFYLLTREQLARAIASGGFLREPYEGRYDMLCSAATDPYTSCGLKKVVCISDIEAFSIHHMSNRYVDKWPVSLEELRKQLNAQIQVAHGRLPSVSLLKTESWLVDRRWSKSYYEPVDEELLAMLPRAARSVLSVGCGWGALEQTLQRSGVSVTALPLDAVIGAAAADRGIPIVCGAIDNAMAQLAGRQFDAVVITDLLHLAEDPAELIARCGSLISAEGTLVVRGPNFQALRVLAKRALGKDGHGKLRSFAESGVHSIGPSQIRRQARKCNLKVTEIRWPAHRAQNPLDRKLGRFGAADWILRARRAQA